MVYGSLNRLEGTYAVPLPLPPIPACPAVEDIGKARLAALAAPCDFLALDTVAAVIKERYADVVWIRLDIADRDPGALLVTLLGAVARLDKAESAVVGEAAARGARRGDWGTAYRQLACSFAAATARPAIMVIEGAEHLVEGTPATLDLLVSALMSSAPGDLDILLISFREWHRRILIPHGEVLGPTALGLNRHAAAVLADAFHLELSAATLDRSFALTRGAAGALKATFSAGAVLGPEVLSAVMAGATSSEAMLNALGRSLLAHADEDTLIALAGVARIGTWHNAMGSALGHSAILRSEPWWLDLAGGWHQLIPAWRAPLRSAGAPAVLGRASLALLADHMARQGSGDRALELYVEAGEFDRAADTAIGLAGDLAGAGGWATLARLCGVLCPAPLAAEPTPGPDCNREAAWWCRLLIRLFTWCGHRSFIRATGALRDRPQDVTAQAGVKAKPAAGSGRRTSLGVRAKALARAGAIAAPALEARPAITAHLLGELRVAFGDRPVEAWTSGRGRAVLEYLLVHRHRKVRRDRLMNVFWPDASCDAARNSLNVAIHGLRQSLRTVAGDAPIVTYQDQCYFIEPTLDVWLDVEAFEERLKSAHQHLASGEVVTAKADFEAAICLYQGEFLADDPYEEWADVTREHLRLCHLDSLDQLGRLRLHLGDYAGCVSVSLKLLACDNCREDAHCRLMRCYSRQGLPQLALGQYHSCVAALRRELNVSPAAATMELFNRIRCREEI